MEFLETGWDRPDTGIWRCAARPPFTHSKVMAWVAVDRGVKAIDEFGLEGPRALGAAAGGDPRAGLPQATVGRLDRSSSPYGSKMPTPACS